MMTPDKNCGRCFGKGWFSHSPALGVTKRFNCDCHIAMEAKMTEREKIMRKVHNERDRQDELWGEQNHEPSFWLSILGEEFGEVCTAVCEHDMENYRDELIQVAAVAVQMIESIDRQTDTLILDITGGDDAV